MLVPEVRALLRPIAYAIARFLLPNSIDKLEQLKDWAQLGVYQSHNQSLAPPAEDENRVIFFGDSITEFWDLAASFPGKPYINRGISGQTTSQMLVRFRADVIALQPKVVVILAGTNDLAGNTGPMTIEMTEANYASLADLARVNHIRIVFASVLPVHDYAGIKQSEFRPPAKICQLNQWLYQYCIEQHHIYLDYYSALVDDRSMLQANLSDDGVHPNEECYEQMTPLVEAAIQQALYS